MLGCTGLPVPKIICGKYSFFDNYLIIKINSI